jgi:C_GCAxxG_C_C family probable redox protein
MPRRAADYDPASAPATHEKVLDAISWMAFSSLFVYGNCCRSTLWAIQVHRRREEPATLRAAAVLAGGLCGSGETCGAVLGGLLAIGEAAAPDPFDDVAGYQSANRKAKRFADEIRELYGSTRCWDIQTAVMGWCCDAPAKLPEWQKAGGPTACAHVCAEAARRAARILWEA